MVDDKKTEQDKMFHLRHGFSPDPEKQKGVTILSHHPRPRPEDEKGVEIIDPRHGRQS